jgi:hypothetical protein
MVCRICKGKHRTQDHKHFEKLKMIEDKKHNIKIAENKEEAAWQQVKKAAEDDIEKMQRAIILNKGIIEIAKCQIKITTQEEDSNTK